MSLETRIVETDSYDRNLFQRILNSNQVSIRDRPLTEQDSRFSESVNSKRQRHVSELELLCEKGLRLLPHFDALLEDLFAILFKLAIRLKPIELCNSSTLFNRRVILAITNSQDYSELKEETALDPLRSSFATHEIASRVLELVKNGELLSEDDLLEAQLLGKQEEKLSRLSAAAKEFGANDSQDSNKAQVETAFPRTAARLAAAAQSCEQDRKKLAEKVETILSELPPSFDSDLGHLAARLSHRTADLKEISKNFAESIGSEIPTGIHRQFELAQKIEKSSRLRELAAVTGALRLEARAAKRKKRERAVEEVYKIGRGNDLGRMLPSELSGLKLPLLRRDFLRRLLENGVLQYDLRGDDRHGRGPMVVCVDGSGSMVGGREFWAKAVTLALSEIARKQNRRSKAIVFSGPEAVLEEFDLIGKSGLLGRKTIDLDAALAFAECFPKGGTDFEKPIRAAIEIARSSQLRGADIVFITDGEATISDRTVEELKREKKRRDLHLFAILVDTPSSRNVARNVAKDGSDVLKQNSAIERASRELGKLADRMTTVTELTANAASVLFKEF